MEGNVYFEQHLPVNLHLKHQIIVESVKLVWV